MSKPLKGFITYAHKNTAAKEELITRLAVMQQRNELVTWHDAEMTGGTKWREDIFKHLADSDILLYLVSAASLASENCNKELAEALNFNIRIIPIILEDCDWQNHQLSDFQALPDKDDPISKWQPESNGWQNVVDGIRKTIEEMQAQVDSSSETSEKELRAELAFQQGNVFMMIGQINMAIEVYSRAIELNPNNPNAYNNRGVAYSAKGDFERTIEDYTKAIELNPNYAVAYSNRGGVYYLKEEYESAIVDFTKATELNPDYAVAHNNRGVAYYLKEEYESAIADFSKAIELNPNYAIAYNNRGRAYEPDSSSSKHAVIRAIKDYNPAIGLNPELAPAYYNRGAAWLRLREWERAISDLTVARDMGINIITAFCSDYESVEDFEERNGVQLPEDIVAMLTLPQA
ncbi:tetratricopeptide repeat protein [Candidatus Poribacteria bacterium]|nr:tetratricopeptide repeat protein [Candidatus Poribacteria bacterium]